MPRNRAPLREQRFRLAVLAASLVAGFGIAALIPSLIDPHTSSHRQHHSAGVIALSLIIVLVLVLAGGVIGLLLGNRLVGDRIECAVREPGTKRWRHGRLSINGTSLTFEQYRFQMRFVVGKRQQFTDVQVGDDMGRRPPVRQIWSINPQLHIIDLTAFEGRFELAALPSRIRELQDRVREPQPQ
ncbi:hypothetical protein [Curtobacterium sp. MCBD17_040]|uniref:hypothetical protein n=1 Tax=Curtobacterium sp. MCBD17_040 TaxID=2175674 RepID=UPI0011B41AA7|nr:hypothetical protein [Curtobacterium sp. MCBD17_040]WIB65837.1 hypothetical protein DEI94_17130 [Curtobacterium sp. MCBD17_040]